jgi:CheY-like chemotaxis protein
MMGSTGHLLHADESQRPVLIVEDDAPTLRLFTLYMNSAGYRVLGTSSGEQALEYAREFHPAAILLDILLPEMDGWEVLSRLKSSPITREIPVLVVSVLERQSLSYRLGAIDHLVKPVDREQLMAVLHRCMALTGNAAPPRILLVESAPHDLEMFCQMLELAGFQVISATGEIEGIYLAREMHPDLVVMNLSASQRDSLRMVAKLRAEPATHDIPISLLTTNNSVRGEPLLLENKIEYIECSTDDAKEKLTAAIEHIVMALRR